MYKILVSLFFVSTSLLAQINQPEIAFVIKEKDLFPEGIAYDASEKSFYVSSIYKNKIVKISSKGEVSDFVSSNADGLLQVLGMKVDAKGMLWACNNSPEHDTINRISNIHVYDLKRKALYKKFQLTDGKSHLFNDLCIAKNGDVYVTDTNAGMVWVIKNGANDIQPLTKPGSISWANGVTIAPDEKSILVCSGSGTGIARVHVDTKKIETFPVTRYLILGMDGLYLYKDQLIGIQNSTFPESVLKMKLNEKKNGVDNIDFLMPSQSQFEIPTTGVIVDNYFYLVANSQMLHIIGQNGNVKDPGSLKNVFILKIKLD